MIRLTELFAQWVQKKTKKTNYFLSSIVLVLFVISTIGGFWWFVNGGSKYYKGHFLLIANEISPVFVYVIIFMALVGAFWGEPFQEKMAFARLKEKIPNPIKKSKSAFLIRLSALTILIGVFLHAIFQLNTYLIYDIWVLTLLFAHILLGACDPLPPPESEDLQTKPAP